MRFLLSIYPLLSRADPALRESAGSRLAALALRWGDSPTPDSEQDYRIDIVDSAGEWREFRFAGEGKPVEGTRWRPEKQAIDSIWTFRATLLEDLSWDVRWRATGGAEVHRGVTYTVAGIEIEFDRFLRARHGLAESETLETHEVVDLLDGHAFLSYVHEDSAAVDRLQASLLGRGVRIWRDRDDLDPGVYWQTAIRRAIADGMSFVAVFSEASSKRTRSTMNQEVTLAIEELQRRPREIAWFFAFVLPGGDVPDWPIGGGQTLRDIHFIKVEEFGWESSVDRLVRGIERAQMKRPRHDPRSPGPEAKGQ